MDRSGKIAGAFRRLTVLRQAKELDAAPPKLPTGPFQVIVADPPWEYASGNSLPYPTMPLDVGEEVVLRVIGRGVGAITQDDVNLAIASDAVIIGFNVRPAGRAGELAQR